MFLKEQAERDFEARALPAFTCKYTDTSVRRTMRETKHLMRFRPDPFISTRRPTNKRTWPSTEKMKKAPLEEGVRLSKG